MRRKFQPYVPVVNRFCGSSRYIGDQLSSETINSISQEEVTSSSPFFIDKEPTNHHGYYTRSKKDSSLTAITAKRAKLAPVSRMKTETEVKMPSEASNSYKTLVAIFATLSDAEKKLFAASGPVAEIINGKTNEAEAELEVDKHTSAYMFDKIHELQALVASLKLSNTRAAYGFEKYTETELRDLMTSDGPAKDIIAELVAQGVSEQCLTRAQGLSGDQIFTIFCRHPEVMEQYEKQCREAAEAYRMICHDSYTQALREVEIDNKAWLTHQKEDMSREADAAAAEGRLIDIDGVCERAGPSPAEKALMSPFMWALPDVPSTPQAAVESTRDAAAKASMAWSSAGKEKLTREMDRESVHNRVMRPMTDHYSGQNY